MNRHAPAKMTRTHNATAAFMAVSMRSLEKMDAGWLQSLSHSTGLSIAQIQGMIADRKAREGVGG